MSRDICPCVVMTFPHIGILDFRTGEMVWNRTGFQKYDDLTSALFSILEKYGEDDEEEEDEDEKKSDEMVLATPVTTPVPSPKRTTSTTTTASSSVVKEVKKIGRRRKSNENTNPTRET